MFGDEEINGKKVGVDPDDKSIHYIYLGNEKYDDLWAYGTVDLKTKKTTREMSY